MSEDESAPPDNGLCGAKPRVNGERQAPCRKYPTKGSRRCHLHGGKSKGIKERVAREELEADVRKVLERRGVAPVEDPLTELGKLAGEVLAWKDAMVGRVSILKDFRYSTLQQGEAIRGEVLLLERAMDRCASVLGLIAKLNIDERLAKITEAQAEMLETALFAALEAAGVPVSEPETRGRVAAEFNRHLAVVAG